MPNFVRAANPIWYFVDLTGNQLNDQFYINFLTNTMPYLPQNVYQDNQGITPWANPLQFNPNGTLPDNLYFEDDLVYRLEIRQGPLSSDPLIYTINNFMPGNSSSPDTQSEVNQDNQISNSFFSQVNFGFIVGTSTPSMVISSSGTYNIAPDWFLKLTGSGSTTITQLIFSGNQNLPSSPVPPFSLSINNSGWSSAILYQRLPGDGGIWANTFVSMSLLARSGDSVARPLTLIYSPNSPGTPVTITSQTLNTGNYEIIQGIIPLPVSTNTTLNNSAYVDMQIVLPPTGIVQLSDVQAMGQNSMIPINFSQTPEETQNRITDHLFHYYSNELLLKPKNTILTGWNFSLNPFQFYPTALTTASSQTQYICDQTIIHQEAASQVSTGQAVANERYALRIKAINGATTNRFALITYIDPSIALPYWGKILSSLAKVRIFTSHGTQVRIKMRAIVNTSLPSTIGATEPISSWPSNSDPIFSGSWTAIAPLNDPSYILPNSYDTDNGSVAYLGFQFNQFVLPANSGATNTLGLVIYTMDPMNQSSGTEDSIVFDDVSLVLNNFGIASQPQTFAEVLSDCQFYYEMSYPNGTLPGTATGLNQLYAQQYLTYISGTTWVQYPTPFSYTYNTNKRSSPNLMLYSSSTGASANVYSEITLGPTIQSAVDVSLINWSTNGNNTKGFFVLGANTSTINSLVAAGTALLSSFIAYHFTADARLGT